MQHAPDAHHFWQSGIRPLIDLGLETGHTILAIAGLIPAVGAAPDLANAAWYAAEGRKTEAAISGAGMVPAFGDVLGAGKLLKILPRGFETIETFAQFSSHLHAGLKAAGADDATVIIRGSAVTGKSWDAAVPFDLGRLSDFDLALASPGLLRRSQSCGSSSVPAGRGRDR